MTSTPATLCNSSLTCQLILVTSEPCDLCKNLMQLFLLCDFSYTGWGRNFREYLLQILRGNLPRIDASKPVANFDIFVFHRLAIRYKARNHDTNFVGKSSWSYAQISLAKCRTSTQFMTFFWIYHQRNFPNFTSLGNNKPKTSATFSKL